MDDSSRFKHLLDPIRDLASNWDIDIADELGNYLEELESVTITFDDGNTNLNFAEAALVIAGSTAVYSKKVEYLHQLVMKALEYISAERNKSKATSGPNKQKSVHMSIEEDERMLFSGDISNLLVDDVLEEAHNIDLETVVPSESGKRINSLLAHKVSDATHLSSTFVHFTFLHRMMTPNLEIILAALSSSCIPYCKKIKDMVT
jgi:condensin-2 complex subunit H2